MDLQEFIKQNIPNVESREDFKQYVSLKECLVDDSLYDRIQRNAPNILRNFLN